MQFERRGRCAAAAGANAKLLLVALWEMKALTGPVPRLLIALEVQAESTECCYPTTIQPQFTHVLKNKEPGPRCCSEGSRFLNSELLRMFLALVFCFVSVVLDFSRCTKETLTQWVSTRDDTVSSVVDISVAVD